MALSEQLKTNLKSNTVYYKNNKDKPVRPEWGFPNTLDQVEAELKKTDLSSEDKKVLLDWMDAFSDIKIENDSTAEARREKIKSEMAKLRTAITPTPAVPVAPSSIVWHVVLGATTQSVEVKNWVAEVKEVLAEINPENLEKAIATSEKFINLAPSAETKATLRGVHGAIIFQILRDAGHNLMMKNGQIEIMPKPGTDVVNLQAKLQTLVNTGRISLDTIKIGMLYSSPSFAKYTEMRRAKDPMTGKESIDPNASPANFITYLTDLQKAGNKSGDIATILGSQAMLQWVNMQQAIKGFQDKGQVEAEWVKQDPKKVAEAIGWWVNLTDTPPVAPWAPTIVPKSPSTPPKPGTAEYYANIAGTEAGKFGADAGKNAGAVLGGIGNTLGWFVKWVWEWAGPLGAWVAVIGLLYAGYKLLTGQVNWHSGFFWSVMALLGWSGLMAGLKRFGIDIPDMTVWDAADKTKKIAEEATEKAKKLAGGSGTTEEKKNEQKKWDEKPAETTGLTDAKKYLRTSITADKSLVERVNSAANIKWNTSTAKFDEYINYIEKDIADTPLSKIFPTDHTKSIFHDSINTELSPSSTIWVKIFKRVMRAYLMGTGYDTLSGTGDTAGKAEKEAFLKNMEITEDDIKNKKLSDILSRIQSKRSGGTKPTETKKEDDKPVTEKPAETLKFHKIAGVDMEVGKNVQLNSSVIARNEKWEYLTGSKVDKLKDAKWVENFGVLANSIVTLGDASIKIWTYNYIKIKYKGEDIFVQEDALKIIPTK